MSSLKENAKTLAQIIVENCPFYHEACRYCTGYCQFKENGRFGLLWIKLEDVEQILEKLEEKSKILCYQCEKCGFIDVTSKEEFEKLPKEQQQYLLRHIQECGGRFLPVKYVLLKDVEEILKEVVGE